MAFDATIFENRLVQVALVVIAACLIQLFSRPFIERLVRRAVQADRYETKLDERKREDTVIGIFHRAFVGVLWLIVGIAMLSLLRVNLAALLTGAGLFGVVFGLGAQSTIKDYLAGVYILTENQYRVGDIVSLSGGTTSANGTSGMVEEISLRMTKLRDLDGAVSIVRNGDAGIITNRTFKYSSVVVNINVDYASNLKQVEKVINKVGRDMLEDADLNAMITEPVSFFRTEDFNESGVRVQCLGKVKPAMQWDVASAFRRQLKTAFEEAGISFAVPHHVVYSVAEPKK